MKKIGIAVIVGVILVLASVVLVIVLKHKKGESVPSSDEDYYKIVDDDCYMSVSQYLELNAVSYMDRDNYVMEFIVKPGSEAEFENAMNENFRDEFLEDDYLYLSNPSAKERIASGDIKHIYFFFREGKVYDEEGFHAKSVEMRICVVEINGVLYAYIYT